MGVCHGGCHKAVADPDQNRSLCMLKSTMPRVMAAILIPADECCCDAVIPPHKW